MKMFEGIRVLSFTHFLQGPSAVQMLADLGADVVKVEPPTGAWERSWAGHDAFLNGVSVFFLLGNRNQRSISLDLRKPEARDVVHRLAEQADVIVENYRPGVMKRLGLDYETLAKVNPRIVYCSCTGYGGGGPYYERPGQDMLLQSMTGLAALSGEAGTPPAAVGASVVDQHAAVLAAFGVAAALFERARTGRGRLVESNLMNAALDLQIETFSYFLNAGPLAERTKPGMGSRTSPMPYGIYRTADGWLAISLSTPDKLAAALELPALASFTPADQFHRRDEIHRIVCERLVQETNAHWIARFDAQDVWWAPVNEYPDVERDPQVAFNRVINEFEHPDAGRVRWMAHPVRYDGKAPEMRLRPPLLGEHTEDVLREAGYGAAEIAALAGCGAAIVARGRTGA